MSTILALNFDSSGSLSPGWTWGSGYSVTSSPSGGITPTSSPNCLTLAATGTNNHVYSFYDTADGNSGNLTIQANVNATGTGRQAWGLLARSSTSSSPPLGATAYWVVLDAFNSELVLYKVVSGTATPLVTVSSVSLSLPGWYQITWTLSGTSLSATVQDLGSGNWLNSSGGWQSGSAAAISIADSSIAAASGFFGLSSEASSNPTYFDDLLVTTAGGGTPSPILVPLGLSTRIVLPGRNPRPRGRLIFTGFAPRSILLPPARGPMLIRSPRHLTAGRVLIPSFSRTPPNPPTLARGLSVRSPRAWHPGRILLPLNPGPYTAPGPTYGTPLRGIVARQDPAGARQHRKGSASVVSLPRASTTATVGPFPGLLRPTGIRCPSGRRGEVAVGRWLPPDAAPNVPQPWAALLRPIARREPSPHRGLVVVAPRLTLGVTPDWPAFFGPLGVIRPVVRIRHRPVPGRVLLPRSPSLATPYVPGPTVPPLSHSAMRPVGRREHPRPAVIPAWLGGSKRLSIGSGLYYNVYASDGPNDPIDYTTPVATTTLLTWTSSPLAVPGTWGFGVRAMNQYGEEQNLDCSVYVIFDATGRDISGIPAPPVGLRAIATAGAGIKVIWGYQTVAGPKNPTGFHVYLTAGATPSYATPAATVAANTAIAGTYQATLSGIDGTSYTIGVRAYNASGEEANLTTVSVTADGTGPTAVTGLSAVAVP